MKKLVVWLEDVKLGTEQKKKDDPDVLSEEDYELYVNELGWAKDKETGKSGKRTPGVAKIKVDSLRTNQQ